MTGLTYSQQQDALDRIVQEYLTQHPDLPAFIQGKDAALKGMTPEEVKAVLPSYPGVVAVAAHAQAHRLYRSPLRADKLKARSLAEVAHARTGIDIHPGTAIGERCFIDHGTGVVIGETAKIGADTLVYHNVTLGAYGNPEESNPEKLAHRHPEIGRSCTISVGAKVLGHVRVGNGVTLGPNSILFGNRLQIGNHVSIGVGAQIGDDNQIADGVRIGPGAIIPRGVGLIDRNVPPYAQVGRSEENALQFSTAIPLTFLQQLSARRAGESSALHYHI